MDMNPNQVLEGDKDNQDLPPPKPPSTNNDGTSLSSTLQRLSLGTASATPLPASPMRKTPKKLHDVSTANDMARAQSPLRRTPSSASLNHDRRSSTPQLQKRTSMSSLQNVGGVTPPRPSLSRQASSNVLGSPSTNMFPKSPLAHQLPEPTPASVAKEHFEKEVEIHKSVNTKTVVIVHDSCYGHRYSRPRTTKLSLSTIVERPERILASVLGLSAAYVRLGGRHHGGRYPPHPDLDPQLLRDPPFQIRKTTRTLPLSSPAVTHVHGNKWMEELKTMCDSAEAKLALNGKELVRPTGQGKDEDVSKRKFHEGDLYLCSESLDAFQGALGGVCDGIDAVFSPGSARRAFVAIRPPGHHCAADYPSGFCWLNNVQVGIIYAAMTHGLTHAAILDFDLHHGDGSQAITWDHNRRATALPKNAAFFKKTPIGYFSLHDINSYPCEMGDEEKIQSASLCIENAHGQSIWNVHLQPWKDSQEFWRLYEAKYTILLEKARNFLRLHTQRLAETENGPQAKAAIFLSAGFDASEWESAGMQRHKANVPTDFYAKFTSDVVRLAEEEGLGADGRVISALEGGYSDRALASGVLSHICGLASVGSESYQADDIVSSRLASEMRQRLGVADRNENPTMKNKADETLASFDTEWWNKARLEELELLVNPPPPPPAPKKPKEKGPPTYSSPTQASTAKRVSSMTSRRSLSSTPFLENPDAFEPPPAPLPDVDWATAAHELSKILIPSDQQTTSCTHEDLNAEATRARRERYSTIGLPTAPAEEGNRMQLRGRKAKAPDYAIDEKKPASRATRRTTIAAVADLPDPGVVQPAENGASDFSRPVITHRRRSSAASSVTSSVSSFNGARTSVASTAPSQRQSSLELGKIRNGAPTTPSATMNDKATNAPAVKKTRVVSGPKAKPAQGRTSPRKAPPVPRVPSAYREAASTTSHVQPDMKPEVKAEPRSQSFANGDANANDLDSLTSNMKKMTIKLNLRPKEEQAAREKAAAEEKKKPTARAPRKPTAPKTTKPATSKAPAKIAPKDSAAVTASTPQAASLLPSNHTDLLDAPSAPEGHPEPALVPSTAPLQTLPPPPSNTGDTGDIGISNPHQQQTDPQNPEPVNDHIMTDAHPPTQPPTFQPEEQPQPEATAPLPSPPLRHALPTQAQPLSNPHYSQPPQPFSPPRQQPNPTSRNNLPVFTSTSPIHFGSRAPAPAPGPKATTSPPMGYRQPEKSYVPYRPPPTMGIGANDLSNVPVGENGNIMGMAGINQGASQNGNGNENARVEAPWLGEGSIWDVPETPQR